MSYFQRASMHDKLMDFWLMSWFQHAREKEEISPILRVWEHHQGRMSLFPNFAIRYEFHWY